MKGQFIYLKNLMHYSFVKKTNSFYSYESFHINDKILFDQIVRSTQHSLFTLVKIKKVIKIISNSVSLHIFCVTFVACTYFYFLMNISNFIFWFLIYLKLFRFFIFKREQFEFRNDIIFLAYPQWRVENLLLEILR